MIYVLYCLSAATRRIQPKKNRIRSAHYDIKSIKHDEVSFPTSLNDMLKLELQNNVQINVYSFNEGTGEYKSEYLSDCITFKKEVNLLVVGKNDNLHYVWIRDLRRLVKTKDKKGKFCKKCLRIFVSNVLFTSHQVDCGNNIDNYSGICTPEKLKKLTGLVRMSCDPQESFKWSIAASLNPIYDIRGRFCINTSPYQEFYDTLQFPEILSDNISSTIQLFIKKLSININVFSYIEKGNKFEIVPYIIPQTNNSKHVDLLLIKEGDCNLFMIIKNLSTLFYPRTNNKHYVCRRCLEICLSEEKLSDHEDLCKHFKVQKVTLPSDKNKVLKFKNIRKQVEIPFICYLDLEAILKPVQDGTNITHEHIPISYSYILYSYIEEVTKNAVVYTGPDCIPHLINELVKEYESIKHYFTLNIPLEMSSSEEMLYQCATSCHICGQIFNKNVLKCRDHDHMTGKFFILIFILYNLL